MRHASGVYDIDTSGFCDFFFDYSLFFFFTPWEESADMTTWTRWGYKAYYSLYEQNDMHTLHHVSLLEMGQVQTHNAIAWSDVRVCAHSGKEP